MSKLSSAFDVLTTDANSLKGLLDKKTIRSVDIVEQYLKQIEKHDAYLHAMLSMPSRETLRSVASERDRERESGRPLRGPFHGIPIIIKVGCIKRDCI